MAGESAFHAGPGKAELVGGKCDIDILNKIRRRFSAFDAGNLADRTCLGITR